jgi:hypothetical protein
MYDYTVLAATGTQVLVKWLNEHGYHIPEGAEPVFQGYVDRGWCWLAIRLNSQRVDKPIVAPRPIRYSYRDKQCVYPLVISRLSADDDNEIVLYVLSRQPYGCENWENYLIPRESMAFSRRSASGSNYEEVFQSLTDQAGGHLFVPEYVWGLNHVAGNDRDDLVRLVEERVDQAPGDESNELYLTRLRAVVRRDAMDRDVVLIPRKYPDSVPGPLRGTAPRHGGIMSSFRITDERAERADTATVVIVLLLVLLVSAGLLLRRRTKRKRLSRTA